MAPEEKDGGFPEASPRGRLVPARGRSWTPLAGRGRHWLPVAVAAPWPPIAARGRPW